jgi:hypothetical protein
MLAMSNYIPWYGKKREKVARRAQELLRILERGGSEKELARAAEEVRASRIRFLRSERARIPPCGVHEARLAELDHEIRLWESMPIEAILAEYGAKPPKPQQSGP